MKQQEQAIIDHANALIKTVTTCLEPKFKENKFVMMLTLGEGDDKFQISFDKQIAGAESDSDKIKMSMYVQLLGWVMSSWSTGTITRYVDSWLMAMGTEAQKFVVEEVTQEDLAKIIHKEAREKASVEVFTARLNDLGLFITERPKYE